MSTESQVAQPGADVSARKAPLGPTIARFVFGAFLTLFGIGGLLANLGVVPMPSPHLPAGAMAFQAALAATGYMVPLNIGTQIAVGLMLLSNRFVPLALTIFAPIIVNIILFHLFLQPAGIGMGAFAAALELYLVWSYRESYRVILTARAVPA